MESMSSMIVELAKMCKFQRKEYKKLDVPENTFSRARYERKKKSVFAKG